MATEPFEDIFDDVMAVTEAGARIDFGYHLIISTEAQLAGVPRYVANMGVPSFKIFMNNRGGEGKRLGLPDIDDGFLLRLCEAAAAHGGMVCPHPENIEVAWVLRDRLMAEDPEGKGGLARLEREPPALRRGRRGAARRPVRAADRRAALYRAHLVAAALEAAQARARSRHRHLHRNLPALPHPSVDWRGGDVGKINPPLRERGGLRGAVGRPAAGDIDTVATDHIHRDISSKEGGIWKASPGCPGIDTLLPVLLSEGHHGRKLPLGRIADARGAHARRRHGTRAPQGAHRGRARCRSRHRRRARPSTRRSATTLHSSAGYSIYEGLPLRGRVRHTLVRGRFTLRDHELIADAVGSGRFVSRHAA